MKQYDLVIIGAGAAGLAAAVEAFDNGIHSILLLEKDKYLGGILLQCIHNGFGLQEFREELSGPEYAQRFADQIISRGIEFRVNSMVINITRDLQVHYSSLEEGYVEVQAKAVICSTGCSERTRGSIATPGTRPSGVLTAGLAQRYMNIDGYMVGKRIFILGSGDIGLIMARRLTLEGAKVLGVAEIMPTTSGLTRNIVQCLNDYGIPLYLHHTVKEIIGKDRVEKVVICPVDDNLQFIEGADLTFDVDTVLLSVGLIPNNPLLEKIGVKLHPRSKGPLVDDNLQTSIPGIFACGNGLFVHDLVDKVSSEGRKAGRNAAAYIKGTLGKAEGEFKVPAVGGEGHTLPEEGKFICIVCPRGCHLSVDADLNVTGNSCPRGKEYAINEVKNPTRTITSTVAIESRELERLPVMTSSPIPKGMIFNVMKEIDKVRAKAPVKIGEILIPNVLGTGSDIVATRNILK